MTFLVAGVLNLDSVADFDRALEEARQFRERVVLDLSHVTLIDRPTLKYLIDLMQHDVRMVICPEYVEHWIYREYARESCD